MELGRDPEIYMPIHTGARAHAHTYALGYAMAPKLAAT